MKHVISRRNFTHGASFALISARLSSKAQARGSLEMQARCAAVEGALGGRLGVCIYEPATRRRMDYRGDELFPLCSTFKFLAAAFVLARVDQGFESLDRRVLFAKTQLVPYSPITEKYAGNAGMSLESLCEAAITLSDNAAGNLLLDSFGGPDALTRFLRALGDAKTRLDRIEPFLNEAAPGDPRDTTTPIAMAQNLRDLILGDTLSPHSRALLAQWMISAKTGDRRIRAKLPEDWRVGDKTGTGGYAATNDIAIIWPPGRPPLIVAVYFTQSSAALALRESALAMIGEIAAAM